MTAGALLVERAGNTVVQDLGRPGYAWLGIAANGAADQHAARTANTLVGNADSAPLVETTGSELALRSRSEALVSVTGAADHVLLDGHRQPAWETLVLHAGSRLVIPAPAAGLRTYLAVNGRLDADPVLDSVSPDPLLGVGRRLATNDTLSFDSRYQTLPAGHHAPIFRLRPPPQVTPRKMSPSSTDADVMEVDVTEGPDLDRMTAGRACLDQPYEVSPQSNHVGLRLLGPQPEQSSTEEILSRGVPVGAVEVPPGGGIIVLLRGRLVTAGYPVIAVVTTESLDRLGQVRPGDQVRLWFCDKETARARLRAAQHQRERLAIRVRAALTASGLADIIDPQHGN
jgi:5-oxoprolinase (ATP-hydrolysing) subunit C